MHVNSVSNPFLGLWREAPVKQAKARTVAGMDLDNIYLQTQTYHPFKDEEPSSWCEKIPETGYNYLEFDSKDEDARLYEETSVAIQQTRLGEKLDVTRAQYEELVAIQKAGIEATKKLNTLGAANLYKMRIPTSGTNDTARCVSELNSETIDKILANVKFDSMA